MSSFTGTFNVFLGRLLLALGIAFIPSVFDSFFADSPLLNKEVHILNLLTGASVGIGLIILLFRSRIRPGFSIMLFSLLLLVFFELGFRLAAKEFMNPDSKRQLSIAQLQSYDEYSAFMRHPFLGYTRRPSVHLDGTEEIPPIYYYNKYGFNGLEVDYSKPEGTIRIAALGGSTTARGYPERMQTYLDSVHQINKIEVLNFGISGWTSAHTMINYLLNVVAFDPDYIVLHQGWNEDDVRNVPTHNFRPDYSHVFSYYKEPVLWDRYLIRMSLTYRYIISKLDRTPAWGYLDESTKFTERERTGNDYLNQTELLPYTRNTQTIIDHALNNGIRVVLTTLPHSTDESSLYFFAQPNIDQCNAITRTLISNKLIFVDLDSIMTGRNDQFIDLGHVTEEGMKLKAQLIGDAILTDLNTADSQPDSSMITVQ